MRSIGFVVVFLVVTWIGLGFLLSDNINTHQALAQAQQQADRALIDKNVLLQAQLNKAVADLSAAQQQNNQLGQQNNSPSTAVKAIAG
jgi:type VI protein secretion system component VasK